VQNPRKRSDLETRTVDDEVIVLDTSGHRVHRLNASASFIWECCDGRNSIAEITARLAAAYELSETAVLNDVHNTLAEFDRLGLMADASTD